MPARLVTPPGPQRLEWILAALSSECFIVTVALVSHHAHVARNGTMKTSYILVFLFLCSLALEGCTSRHDLQSARMWPLYLRRMIPRGPPSRWRSLPLSPTFTWKTTDPNALVDFGIWDARYISNQGPSNHPESIAPALRARCFDLIPRIELPAECIRSQSLLSRARSIFGPSNLREPRSG